MRRGGEERRGGEVTGKRAEGRGDMRREESIKRKAVRVRAELSHCSMGFDPEIFQVVLKERNTKKTTSVFLSCQGTLLAIFR